MIGFVVMAKGRKMIKITIENYKTKKDMAMEVNLDETTIDLWMVALDHAVEVCRGHKKEFSELYFFVKGLQKCLEMTR